MECWLYRKAAPEAMSGQSNDIYEQVERSSPALLPGGMALLYASAPIYSHRSSKDPERAAEIYAILPEKDALQRSVEQRRLIEDALVEIGFPLEKLTAFDVDTGRVVSVHGDAQEDTTDVSEDADHDVATILAALQAPLPYIRRGAWGKWSAANKFA